MTSRLATIQSYNRLSQKILPLTWNWRSNSWCPHPHPHITIAFSYLATSTFLQYPWKSNKYSKIYRKTKFFWQLGFFPLWWLEFGQLFWNNWYTYKKKTLRTERCFETQWHLARKISSFSVNRSLYFIFNVFNLSSVTKWR